MTKVNLCLSVNENDAYLEHLELCCRAWRKFFPEWTINLAFVTDRDEDSEFINQFIRPFVDHIVIYQALPGISTGNLAKMVRYIMASTLDPNVPCMIHDIDSVPLSRKYWTQLLTDHQPGKLLAVGHDVYENEYDGAHAGKFPASSMMGLGSVFNKLINPRNLSYKSLIQSWVDIHEFDHKESILNPHTIFSDESLIRALIYKNLGDAVTRRNRNINVNAEWVCRGFWNLDEKALEYDQYIECHLPRKGDEDYSRVDITPIKNYIYHGHTKI